MPDTQRFPVLSAPVSRDPGSASRSEGGIEPSWPNWSKLIDFIAP